MIKVQKLNTYLAAWLMATVFLSSILFLYGAGEAHAGSGASLYFSPTAGTFQVDSTFNVSLFVNTAEKNINAVEIYLRFDRSKLQVVDPVAGVSFIEFWITPPTFSNKDGTILFRGGLPNPGIRGSNVLVSTITFRARAPGEGVISIEERSAVLANDARGTNILSQTGVGRYKIVLPQPKGPKVSSPTHPDSLQWSSDNNPVFEWEQDVAVRGFSYILDRVSSTTPDNVSEGSEVRISYSDLEDGIWYFHVKARNKEGRWGGASHYFIQIDATPPAAFPLLLEPGNFIASDESPVVSFVTTDSVSGISRYEVQTSSRDKEQIGFFIEVESPYRLTGLESGKYDIVVRAYDKAGNYQEEEVDLTVKEGGIFFGISDTHVQIFNLRIRWFTASLLFILIIGALIALAHTMYHKKRFPPIVASMLARVRRRQQIIELKEEIEELEEDEF